MPKSYAQLKSAIAKLEQQAAALRATETSKVVAKIRESIATYGLTVEHLFGRVAKALKPLAADRKAGRKGAGIPKYRDPKTGKTWTGFGKAPGWIASARNRDKFLIDQSGVVAAPSGEKDGAPVAAVAKKATRKARTVATPVKKSSRAKKVAAATNSAAPNAKAEKPVAKKGAAKKSAPSRKAAPAKKAEAATKATKARKAASKAPKKAATKTVKPKAPAKTRRSRTAAKAAAPAVAATAPATAETTTSAA